MKTLQQEVIEQIEYHKWVLSGLGVLDHEYKDTEELITLFERILENLQQND